MKGRDEAIEILRDGVVVVVVVPAAAPAGFGMEKDAPPKTLPDGAALVPEAAPPPKRPAPAPGAVVPVVDAGVLPKRPPPVPAAGVVVPVVGANPPTLPNNPPPPAALGVAVDVAVEPNNPVVPVPVVPVLGAPKGPPPAGGLVAPEPPKRPPPPVVPMIKVEFYTDLQERYTHQSLCFQSHCLYCQIQRDRLLCYRKHSLE